MTPKQLKMKQLAQGNNALYALGEDGVVYVYNGHKDGWASLCMDKMTQADVKRKFKERETRYQED